MSISILGGWQVLLLKNDFHMHLHGEADTSDRQTERCWNTLYRIISYICLQISLNMKANDESKTVIIELL